MRAEATGKGTNGMSAFAGDEETRALSLPREDATKHQETDPHRTPDLQKPGLELPASQTMRNKYVFKAIQCGILL